jgi:simple sugar transport system permease protein
MKSRHVDMLILGLLVVAASGLFGALNPRQFLSLDNIQSMAFQIPELGILSLGMMIAMLSGGINLSLIANANLFSVTSMIVFRQLTANGAMPATPIGVIVSAACGLAAALGVGLLNGFLIAVVDVSPVLATLGSMTFVSGLNILLTKGYTLSGVPPAIITIGNGTLGGVPIPLIVLLISALLMALILNRTKFGFSTYMYGSNPQATRYSGINNRFLIIRVYLLSSVFAVLAAIIMMGRFNSAKADYGESYLLITVLAGVLGGVDPSGGFGRVLGVMLALVILQIILSGLNLLRINPNLSLVIWGGILIAYMGLKYVAANLRVKRGIRSQKA